MIINLKLVDKAGELINEEKVEVIVFWTFT